MLSVLEPSPNDPILQLAADFREDPRPQKLDLGVGVYKDSSGATVIPKAVKAAEARLLEEQATKSYVGLLGDVEFNAAMAELVYRVGLITTVDTSLVASKPIPFSGADISIQPDDPAGADLDAKSTTSPAQA